MNNNPLVSVIIPCFNHGKYIEETLQSIDNAKDKYPVEIIIVNDGSTDNYTLQIFKKLEEQGYFVLHQENQGLPFARNNGIKIAKGKYILPVDSDDKIKYPYLNAAITILEKDPNIDIVYGDVEYFGNRTGVKKNKPIDKKHMLFSNHVGACAVYRKKIWESVGGYSINLPERTLEDWNFWLRCINNNMNFYYLNETCFQYRILDSSMLRTTSNKMANNIFAYNVASFPEMYMSSMREDYNKLESIFHGGIFRRVTKTILNYFGLHKY